ncbi:MAG: AraC family transcriptional regulator [Verrucomicrobiales bacterium]|nr:AraC family transcriptional regulator [Verrucomicrobiales bacterium]
MRNYRPLLIQDIGVSMSGMSVQRLRINQHTPEAQWNEHSHEHGQLIVYLTGRGHQMVDGKTHAARPGSVIYVEKGTSHAFRRQAARQPLCLVIDLELGTSPWPVHVFTQLANADLAQVRGAVSRLFSMLHVEQREMALLVGSIVLEVLHVTLRTVGWLKPVNRFGDSRRLGTTKLVERVLDRYEREDIDLETLAKKAGYQQDYLNRLLKQECGLTLGQMRARQRLKKAQQLLQDRDLAIFEVAERIGMLDHNYFSRWFRQQTGVTPSKWRKNPTPVNPL